MVLDPKRIIFKTQSVLCAVLMLVTQVWLSGCGQGSSFFPVTASLFHIPITPGDELSTALAGSQFSGAVGMDIFPAAQRFRLVFRDSERDASGTYAFVDGQFTIRQFSFKNDSAAATITFDEARRVMSMVTSDGSAWTRPPEAARTVTGGAAANPYMAANPDLVAIAAQMDQAGAAAATQGPAPTGAAPQAPNGSAAASSGKNAAAAEDFNGVRAILTLIAAIWAPLAGILQPLLALFTVTTLLDKALVLRFDGTWRASNASSDLLVTIADGKVTMIVDDGSKQELEVVDSRLESISGNKVTWIVDASVLGQAAAVEFTFDVEEMADGTLQGTLTVLGDTFSRVPLTMTRV